MPRNGSGVYQLPSGINPVVTQTLITSNWANTTMNDIAAALTQSVSRDGQSPMTGNLNMAGFQLINLGTPTQPGNAVSLSYVQTGQQWRLTNVSGTANAITANLPGAATSLVLGQLAELIPAANNTGPVTLNVNGIGYSNVLTGLGNQLGANSLLSGKIYLLAWDGVEWQIISAPNQNTFAQSAISGWDRPAGGYPAITKVNANTVAVPSGTGRIIAPSTRDVSGVTEVSWSAKQVVLTNVANAWATTLAVDANGNIVQLIGLVQAQWARQYIILGVVGHVDGQIETIVMQPSIYGDMAYEAYDLGQMFHNQVTAGGTLSNATAPMSVDVAAGTMWLVGGNPNNANQPNFVNFAAQPTIGFWPTTANNTVGAKTTVAPTAQYDPAGAGVVTNIPAPLTQAVIHRLYQMAGQYIWVYGQTLYGSLQNAIQALNTDNSTFKPPGKLIGATLFGYVIAQANCANINDGVTGQILAPNATQTGSASGSGITEAPLTGLGYARRNAAWIESPYYSPVDGSVSVGHNGDGFAVAFHVNAAPGYGRSMDFQSSGIKRWAWNVTGTAEGGANAGSDFNLTRYADNGGVLDTPISVVRSTGAITFADNPINLGNGPLTIGNGNVTLGTGTLTLNNTTINYGNGTQNFGNGAINFGTGVVTFNSSAVNVAAGPLTIGSNTFAGPAVLNLNCVSPNGRNIQFLSAGKNRWVIQANAAAESGSNAGSDFLINNYADAGTNIGTPFKITRSNGVVTTAYGLTAQNGQTVVSSVPSLNIAAANGTCAQFLPSISTGSYNPNTQQLDCVLIYSMFTQATNGFSINPWSTTASGTRWGPNGAVTQSTSGGVTGFTIQDVSNNMAQLMLWGNGTYNKQTWRENTNALEWVNSQYNAVVGSWNDYGGGAASISTHAIYAMADNAYPIGQASARFTVLYAVSGTINTCDANEKFDIKPSNLGLDFVNSVPISTFKFKVGHNEVTPELPPARSEEDDPDGEDRRRVDLPQKITPIPGTRNHVGPMAQDIAAALTKVGVDPGTMGMWVLDNPKDASSLQGLRPDECMWVLWKAVQELSAQVATLQAKVR